MSYPKETQEFFVEIVEDIKKTLDPEYILIAGSFGKSSWLLDGDTLLSDFEFEFICKKKWSLKKKKELLKKFNSIYPYEINLKGNLLSHVENKISTNYSNAFPGYVRLNFFDAFSDSQILYTKHNHDLKVDLSVDEIPAWEVWRLMVNRIGDILSLQVEPSPSQTLHNYYWLKIFESIGDAYLILNKSYEKNISRRHELWTKELIDSDSLLPNLCKDSFEIVASALDARNHHDINRFDDGIFDLSEKNQMINSWLTYIEGKLLEKEGIVCPNISFSKCYMQSKTIQNKYLEVNNLLAVPISNSIRLLPNYKALMKLNFRIHKMGTSWRHLILIVISELFKEQTAHMDSYVETKRILREVTSQKSLMGLSEKELIETVLKLWKIVR